MIEPLTDTSFAIDATGVDPRQPHPCFARGVHHASVAFAFAADLAAHHALVALLVAEATTEGAAAPIEPPLRAPIAANAPNGLT